MKTTTKTQTATCDAQIVAKSPRGFNVMDPELQRKIASAGGKASHQSGRGHEFTSEEARAAGKKRAAMRAAAKPPKA